MALIKVPSLSKIGGKKNKNNDVNLGTVFDKNSRNKILGENTPFAIREMYNTIRTRLMFTSKGDRCPVYVVTSAEPGDGKTLNAINIAITFAEMGKKCLIIDGDMRNPSIHKFFDIRRENGLSEVLAGIAETVNVRKTKYENLFLLPAGGIPPRPGELLGSEKLKELMSFVREHFDYVFIDTPPAGLVSDASLLADIATGYVIVAMSGYTRMPELKDTIKSIESIGGSICGFVVNGIATKRTDFKYGKGRNVYGYKYRYRYRYRYGREAEQQEKRE